MPTDFLKVLSICKITICPVHLSEYKVTNSVFIFFTFYMKFIF